MVFTSQIYVTIIYLFLVTLIWIFKKKSSDQNKVSGERSINN